MNYTLKPTITEKRIIERRFPAWQECGVCQGGIVAQDVGETVCGNCSGYGGVWHPRVAIMRSDGKRISGLHSVTKSSTLVHSGERCRCQEVKVKQRDFSAYEIGMLNQCPVKKIPRGECGCHDKVDLCRTVGVRDWSFTRGRFLCRDNQCPSCWPADHDHNQDDICPNCHGSGIEGEGEWRVEE